MRSRFCASINVHGGLSEAGASFFAHTPVLLPPVANGPGSGGLSAFTALLITLQVVIGGLGLSRSAGAGASGGGGSFAAVRDSEFLAASDSASPF